VWYFVLQLPPLTQWELKAFWYPERFDYESHWTAPLENDRFEVFDVKPEPGRFAQQHYLVDQEAIRTFRSNPLPPANWAALLNKTRVAGSDSVVISDSLSWPDADELSLRTLEHQLSEFRSYAIAIDLTHAPKGQPFPTYLEDSAVTLKGDASALPEINSVVTHPSIQTSHFGFRIVEENPNGIPLLARWGDHILPSLELAYLISASDSPPQIELGKQIVCDVVIPIDDAGRYHPPEFTPSVKSASALFTATGSMTGLTVITRPEDPPHFSHLGETLAHQASRIPREPTLYRFLPALLGVPILLIFISLFLSRFRLLALSFLVLPPALAVTKALWIPVSPFLAAALIILLLPRSKKAPIPSSIPQGEAPQLPKRNLHRQSKRPRSTNSSQKFKTRVR